MRVISGAGEFKIEITKVIKEDRTVVMIGRMGYWETRLILTGGEALNLAKAMALPLLRSILRI